MLSHEADSLSLVWLQSEDVRRVLSAPPAGRPRFTRKLQWSDGSPRASSPRFQLERTASYAAQMKSELEATSGASAAAQVRTHPRLLSALSRRDPKPPAGAVNQPLRISTLRL